MMQCENCEFFSRNPAGEVSFSCDPFSNIKEPDCLLKWQLMKINQMVVAYHSTLDYYRKLAPMQEKMFKVVERELDDMNESEKWKTEEDDSEEDDSEENQGGDEDHWKPSESEF